MKNKFLIALTAVFVLGLAMAVYAFNRTTNDQTANASAVSSCPMKDKTAATAENHSSHSCCDKANCCCKTGACPMKSSGATSAADCCANCCGGSCPMKNKSDDAVASDAAKAENCPHNRTAGV